MVLSTRSARFVLGLVALLAVLGFAAYREVLRHGFSAREKPWAIEEFVARRLRRLATGTETKQLVNPFAPDPGLLAGARDHYADHCAVCHGDDGSGKTEIGDGLYPPVPDLRGPETQELSDGEIFSIIRNGVRFTGMPGWGGVDSDDEIWQLVLLVRHLPDLTDEEREQMRAVRGEERGERSMHHHH